MLWLFVIFLIGGLSFVLFHKPHVNSAGARWTPPAQRPVVAASAAGTADGAGHDPAEDAVTLRLQRDAAGGEPTEDAVTLRLHREPASPTPDTFDFNDLFAGRRQDASERPRV